MVGCSVFGLLVVGRGVLALLSMVDGGVRVLGALNLLTMVDRGVLSLLAMVDRGLRARGVLGLLAMIGCGVLTLLVVGLGVLGVLGLLGVLAVLTLLVVGLGVPRALGVRALGVLGLLATVGLPVIDGRSQHRLGGAVSAARRNLALALLGNPDRAIVRKQGDAEFEFGQMGLTIQRI